MTESPLLPLAIRLPLLLLATISTAMTASAQTEVTGKTTVEIANAVSGVVFQGNNKTNREICDFVLTLGTSCGVNFSVLMVTSSQSGGADDWDVDDNMSGMSQENGENDDTDSSPGLVTRLDKLGTGDESSPQDQPGRCIKKNKLFDIEIMFSGTTTGTCDLCIAPTDLKGYQLASLPDGMEKGENVYVLDNPTIVGLGLGSAAINQTTHFINALRIETNGEFHLVTLFEIDSQTDTDVEISQIDCGQAAAACTLQLTEPVPPGRIVSFDAEIDGLSPGTNSLLVVTPKLTFAVAIPTLSTWGLLTAGALLMAAGLWHLARRRLAASNKVTSG